MAYAFAKQLCLSKRIIVWKAAQFRPVRDVRFKIPHTYVSSLSILTYPLSPHSPFTVYYPPKRRVCLVSHEHAMIQIVCTSSTR